MAFTDDNEIQTKSCRKCKEVKPYSDYHRNKGFKSGLEAICKACNKARVYAYREKNRERVAAISKRYRERYPERAAATAKKWQEKNPDHDKKRYQRRRQDPAAVQVMRAANQRRKVLHRAATPIDRSLKTKEYRWLYQQPCSYCLGPGGEIDHVVPLSKGGNHTIDNLVAACRSCNAKKSNKSLLHFLLAQKVERSWRGHGIHG